VPERTCHRPRAFRLAGRCAGPCPAQNIFRPTYQGTGEIFFGPPIFGEYEILDLAGDEWILEQGSYVCSDIAVEVGVWRNKALSALFGGEGWFQTSVKGRGKVVMLSRVTTLLRKPPTEGADDVISILPRM
jgi:uncharacterized protein (AIM24 family)